MGVRGGGISVRILLTTDYVNKDSGLVGLSNPAVPSSAQACLKLIQLKLTKEFLGNKLVVTS